MGQDANHLLQQIETKFSAAQHKAALLLAENELPNDTEVAKAAGVSRTTLHRWKKDEAFNGLTGDYIGQIQASALKFPIAKKHRRVERLQELWDGCRALRMARAEAARQKVDSGWNPAMTGETTGLVAVKTTGFGRNATQEAAFDAALVKAEADLAEEAAKELGQRVDKAEVNGTVSVVRLVGVNVDAI
jgi:hypothetical protein